MRHGMENGMRRFIMASVGDGLCTAGVYGDHFHSSLRFYQHDWGGSSITQALDGYKTLTRGFCSNYCWENHQPESFVLSHFHLDHYIGLLAAARDQSWKGTWTPNNVFFPGIPEFQDKKAFLAALFSINAIQFGAVSGLVEYDFLKAISKLRGGSQFFYQRLYQGNEINLCGERYEVAWPPNKIESTTFTSSVKNALDKFSKALEENDQLREIHSIVIESNLVSDLLGSKDEAGEPNKDFEEEKIETYARGEKLSKSVIDANIALKNIANQMSLVFYSRGKILALGDVAKPSMKSMVDWLVEKEATNFDIIIAAHHGTYWHDEMRKLRARKSFISCGKKMHGFYKPQWATISGEVSSTYLSGDLLEGDINTFFK